MDKYILKSVFFKKLKGLNDINIVFSDSLTAIMGVNGSGKTTVIHALACLYQPDGNGENHKFPEFFVPNTDSLWKGSELHVVNEFINGNTHEVLPSRQYGKGFDRWTPKYQTRPYRNVYYIGIDSCLPDIEKKTPMSRINYKTRELSDRVSRKAIEKSAYILNKNYEQLLDNTFYNKHLLGVKLKDGLKYSSLSMGSGEQRVIKIINVLLRAEAYSLILIDEIDLLLHVSALRRLIETIYDIAVDKHIQIVFTTHSLEMTTLPNYVMIQYIANYIDENRSLVFNRLTPDLIFNMTGQTFKTHYIYVEDELAKSIVRELVRKKNLSSSIGVVTYGAIENAFTLAASFIIQEKSNSTNLIVLDGDLYKSPEEKGRQIKKKLSGTEDYANESREKALSFITEFKLPEGTQPEKFLHETILRCFNEDNEILQAAKEIYAVQDSHEWLSLICDRLELSVSAIVRELFSLSYEDEQFKSYINPIEDWIDRNCI